MLQKVLIFLFIFMYFSTIVVKGETLYQTSIKKYNPKIDLRTDIVMLHGQGQSFEQDKKIIKNWKSQTKQNIFRMWFAGSDAGKYFVNGHFDGKKYNDDIETRRDGSEILIGNRPYMVPTEEWNNYMQEIALNGLKGNASGVAPEEPLAHADAGYSSSFKNEWEDYYGEKWVSPHSSSNAFWKASRLKSFLYYRNIKTILESVKKYSETEDKKVSFLLPTHSLISHASQKIIYPNNKSIYLDGLSGMIAQIWTGTIDVSFPQYSRNNERRFFDSAWTLYSSFANLGKNIAPDMYFLGDPVEDNPDYDWDDYKKWYNITLVSQLMFPEVNNYQVMPWPERIFLSGYDTGPEGSPAPAEYLTQLMVNIAVLADMKNQEEINLNAGFKGVGVFIGDSLAWQRGGPGGSSMKSLSGLVMPLLDKGIPLQIIPIERIIDNGYLNDYNILLLSYEMFKPLKSEYHQVLKTWVEKGGTLIFFESKDRYAGVDEWWKSEGYNSPGEHLVEKLGIKGNLDEKQEDMSESEFREVFDNAILDQFVNIKKDFQNSFSRPEITKFNLREEGKSRAGFVKEIKNGYFIYLGLGAEDLEKMSEGDEALRNLVKYGLGLQNKKYRESNNMVLNRGDYVIGRTIDEDFTIKGKYIDLLDTEISPVKNPEKKNNEIFLLYDISNDIKSEKPKVLYGSHEIIKSYESEKQTVILSAGPWQTRGVVRMFASDKKVKSLKGYVLADTDFFSYNKIYDRSLEWLGLNLPAETISQCWPRLEKEYTKKDLLQITNNSKLRQIDISYEKESTHNTVLINFEQWHSGTVLVIEWE